MAKKDWVKALVIRYNGYHFDKMIRGRRIRLSLETSDRVLAEKKAQRIYEDAMAGAWDRVDGLKKFDPGVGTVGDLLEVYGRSAELKGVAANTRKSYVTAMRRVVAVGMGVKDVESVSLSKINGSLARQYQEQALSDGVARSSVAANMRNAAAIVSRNMRTYYTDAGLQLPDCVDAFAKARHVRADRVEYELPSQDLIERTVAAGRAMREEDADIYAVFLMAYDIAMRSNEVVWARRSWIESGPDGSHVMVIQPDKATGFMPKGKRFRKVPMRPEVAEWLLRYAEDRDFILPGATKDARYNKIRLRFTPWMRELGWDSHKAAHELRKLMGSHWFTQLGPQVAQEWLGHASVSTTCQYYARLMPGQYQALSQEVVG